MSCRSSAGPRLRGDETLAAGPYAPAPGEWGDIMNEIARRPRRWPWVVACLVLFGLGYVLGGLSVSAFTARRFNVPCPPLFAPKPGEAEPLARGTGIFPPQVQSRVGTMPMLGGLARVRGQVAVLVRVEANGNISRVELIRSSGFCPYDKQALADVWRWKFLPASRLGESVAAWLPVV